MTMTSDMHVTLRLPAQTLFEGPAAQLTAVAENGGFGILPNHIDFVTALVPSVLTLITPEGRERLFGIDEGLLVKKGNTVSVAVRRGVEGDGLDTLHDMVRGSFIDMEDDERAARAALSRLEADMVRRFASLRKQQP